VASTVQPMHIIGIAGKAGAGKDTFYETVLRPRGYIRLQMTLYRKIWLVSTGQGSWEEIFYTKPPRIRKLLQEDITRARYDHDEEIWLRTLQNFMRALREIVGVDAPGVAVTDLRFLIEMKGIKELGGKILHLEAPDQQANIASELRGHRSEVELDSPEVR
jgi:dephospho-CoA kinase